MRSIRSIIFLHLFWIIFAFSSVVSGVAYYLTNEAIRQFAVKDAITELEFVISNIRANYSHELQYLDTLANIDGFQPFNKETAVSMVKRFLLYENLFGSMHLYAKNGELIFAEKRSSLPKYTIESNFYKKQEPEFIALAKQVLDKKRPAASETFFTSSGDLYQTYITPVFADKEHKNIFGLLSGGVFPRRQKIDHMLAGLKLGQDNFILISDSHGRLMGNDGITEAEVLHSLKPHINRAMQVYFAINKAKAGKTSLPPALLDYKIKIGAAQFILMSLPIQELRLIVTIGLSTGLIDQKQEELTHRLLVALILGLLFSLFGSILAGERLAKPFREIAETINKINIGNFAARVTYNKDDEIGQLSKVINTIAEKIEKSEYLGNLWSNESELAEPADAGTPGLQPDNENAKNVG